MKRLVYGLIFLFLASGQAFAVDLVSPIICRLVLENFIRKGKGHENVVCLAKSLTAEIPKFDIAKAKVLYIFSEIGIIDRVKYAVPVRKDVELFKAAKSLVTVRQRRLIARLGLCGVSEAMCRLFNRPTW